MRVYCLRCSRALGKEVIEKYRNIQVIDSRYVFGKEHMEFALAQAEKAFQRKTNISKELMIEVLVRASAQRQIKKALELYGVDNSGEVYVLSDALPPELIRSYGCVEATPKIDPDKYEKLKETFGIGEAEIAAVAGEGYEARVEVLKNIIKERIALLEVL